MGLDSADKIWMKDETAALIALYESERSLYDKKDKHYLNAQKRNEGYERIHQVILRMKPECTVDDIKSRIKYLRSLYASELLRRNISVEAGLCTKDTYKPVMWCFGLLQFLDDFISSKKIISKIDSSEEEKCDEPDIEDNSSCSKTVPTSKRKSRNFNPKKKKKKEVHCPSPSDSLMDITEVLPVQNNNFDREDIFGQYVASEIRALRDNPLLYLQTKQSILEILTNANFECLNHE